MNIRIDEQTNELLSNCEKVYRDSHPEMDMINISKNKMIYEVVRFYLRGTEYEY